MRNACTIFTKMIIPIIQKRREEGSSSSSRSFMRTSTSRVLGEKIASMSERITSERIPKIVIETGFWVMSENELMMTFAIEENIVSLSI